MMPFIYISDFMRGLMAALALRGIKVLPNEEVSLSKAFSRAYQKLEQENQFNIRFRIKLNPIHQDSLAAIDGLYHLAKMKVISSDSEFIYLKIQGEEALSLFNSIPGDKEMYDRLTVSFLRSC